MHEVSEMNQPTLKRLSGLQHKLDVLSHWFAVGLVFAIPISATLTTIMLIAALFFTVVAGNWQAKLRLICRSKIIVPFVMLFLLVLMGMIYTTGTLHEALHVLTRYKRFVLLLLLFPLFTETKWRKAAVIAFLTAMGITLICSYGNFFGLIPLKHHGIPAAPFVSHINTSLMLSFSAFLLLLNYHKMPRLKWLMIAMVALIVINVLFVSMSRFGYGALGLFSCYFFWVRYRWKGLCTVVVVLGLLYGLAFATSAKFKHRVDQAHHDVVIFQQGQNTGPVTIRLYYARNALKILKKHPVLGTGTGSFGYELSTMVPKPINGPAWPVGTNSEWFNMVAQYGSVGVIVLILFYYLIWRYAGLLEGDLKHIVRGLVLVTIASSFPNAALMGSISGYFFAIVMIVVFASRLQKTNALDHKR